MGLKCEKEVEHKPKETMCFIDLIGGSVINRPWGKSNCLKLKDIFTKLPRGNQILSLFVFYNTALQATSTFISILKAAITCQYFFFREA
jgi:hypothetical protein